MSAETIEFASLPEWARKIIPYAGDVLDATELDGTYLSVRFGTVYFEGKRVLNTGLKLRRVIEEVEISDLPDWVRQEISAPAFDQYRTGREGESNILYVNGNNFFFGDNFVLVK